MKILLSGVAFLAILGGLSAVEELSPSVNGNTFDIGKRKAGEEFLVMIPLETSEDLAVNEASTNCVCVNFLDYPQTLQKGETAIAIVYFVLDKAAKFNFELKLKTDKKDLVYKLVGETYLEEGQKKVHSSAAHIINPVSYQPDNDIEQAA